MLAVAFAILISTVIEAKTSGRGQSITNFHTAVVLDLSFMNNTSTFILFLLYAHHRSINDTESMVIPTTWSGWRKLLFFPLRRLVTGIGGTSLEHVETINNHADGNQSREKSGDNRAILVIVEWMGKYNLKVFDSVLELLSKLVACCKYHSCCLIKMLNYILQPTSVIQCKYSSY